MLKILGQLKTVNFTFGTNGKLLVLDVPILKHFRVCCNSCVHSEVHLRADFENDYMR